MISRKSVRTKVLQSLYSHYTSDQETMREAESELGRNIQNSYDLYNLTLWLGVEMLKLSEEKIEWGKNKRLPKDSDLNPSMNFANNRVLHALRECDTLIQYLDVHKLTWIEQTDMMKRFFKMFEATDQYIEYVEKEEVTLDDDVAILDVFFRRFLVEQEEFEQELEEISIYWNDDYGVVLSMLTKTFKSFKKGATMNDSIVPMFMSDDIEGFSKELLRKSILAHDDSQEVLVKYTKNWDVDRIALMDTIILEMAICEFISFPSIPVKVTLNEYIELAKSYSTQSSGVFVNGVLDRISKDYLEQKKINKVGRGLL